MYALIGIFGLLGFVVFFILLIVAAIIKKPKKLPLIGIVCSFVLFIVSIAATPTTPTYQPVQEEPIATDNPRAEISDAEKIKRQETKEREIALATSQQMFEEGMKLFNEGDYEQAIETFNQVIPEDNANYALAIEHITKSKTQYSQVLIEQAIAFFDESKYEETIDTAQKALNLNPALSGEVEPLIHESTEKFEAALAEQMRTQLIEDMRTFQGEGDVQIAVSDVIALSSFFDGFTTWTPENPEKEWFLKIAVHAVNVSLSSLHVNPHYITIIANNHVYNPDMNTYSMDRYFDAVNLQPGTQSSGWILFLVPKEDSYTLVYEAWFDRVITKEIIVTEVQ